METKETTKAENPTGKLRPHFLIPIILISFGFGIFSYFIFINKTYPFNTKFSPTPTLSLAPEEKQDNSSLNNETSRPLSAFMAKHCVEKKEQYGFSYEANLSDLPLKVSNLISTGYEEKVFCSLVTGGGYLRLTKKNSAGELPPAANFTNFIYIWDGSSLLPGHGGAAEFGFSGGIPFWENNSLIFYYYIAGNEGVGYVGDVSIKVAVAGTKTVYLPYSEPIYITMASLAMPVDDPRLIKTLLPFSKQLVVPREDGKEQIENQISDWRGVDDALFKRFFTKPDYGQPEWQTVENIKNILSSFSLPKETTVESFYF